MLFENFSFRKCIIYDILKTYVVYAVMEKYQVELRELIFNNILQNGTKDSESTLDVQWRLDTLNTNKIFAGCFNFFRKWKVKKNQITLIEKLNTGVQEACLR